MKRHRIWLVALALVGPAVARAQFYDLDGSYRCLTVPDAACTKQFEDQPSPPPPAVSLSKETPVAPTLKEAIARVKKGKPTPDDISLIEHHAAAKEAAAVEVLAWCKLGGIGMPADAIAAYRLYREAADLGVANARHNQIAIYETRLSSDQRQQVLLEENER